MQGKHASAFQAGGSACTVQSMLPAAIDDDVSQHSHVVARWECCLIAELMFSKHTWSKYISLLLTLDL